MSTTPDAMYVGSRCDGKINLMKLVDRWPQLAAQPWAGMLILDVVDVRIMDVEVLDRPTLN